MERKNGAQTITIAVLAVAILVMAVGFAGYNAQLKISGATTLSAAKWDVHFVSDAAKTGHFDVTSNNTITGVTPTVSGTNVSYTVTLPNPGDVYEFTIDVVNEGTFDAKLDSIVIAPTITAVEDKNLDYTVWYNGTEYKADATHGTYTVTGVTLPKKSGEEPGRATVKVRTEYQKVTNEADLLSEDMEKTMSVTLNYSSVDAA